MEKRILVTYAVPQELVEIKWSGVACFYLQTGIGKMRSAHYLTEAITGFNPDVVVNIGTSGSIQHKVGDVFFCTQFIDRDIDRVKCLGLSSRVDTSITLMDKGVAQSWVNEGTCNTGDSFVTADTDLAGDVIDMEAFVQAWICEKKGIPFVSIKYVTDIIGKNSVKLWEEKLNAAKHGLDKYINHIIKGLY